jgi:glyoxylase-like metal-dependent hydrolase (beta-lactamase superfamily II)
MPTIFLSAIIVVMFAGIASITEAAQPANDIVLAPQRISAHGWFFQGESGIAAAQNKGFMSNAGFVVTDEGVVVFDALGTPALGRAMIAAIRKVTKQPIKRVIVSHYHADHIYGLQAFKADGAQIWAHRKARLYLDSAVAKERLAQRRVDLFPWVDEETVVVPPDLWLDGDTSFRMGGITFELLYSEGAHSPEDLMMYVEDVSPEDACGVSPPAGAPALGRPCGGVVIPPKTPAASSPQGAPALGRPCGGVVIPPKTPAASSPQGAPALGRPCGGDRLLFAGDLIFAGRIPYVGSADSAGWLTAMDKMIALHPSVVVPGHGPVSRDVERDLVLTRDYLVFLRAAMGRAVRDLEPFDDAYTRTDWSRFRALPAFEQANRLNAYGTYLLMEQEILKAPKS